MTSPNHIDDVRISALAEEAFQWFIGLANIPEGAIIPGGGDEDAIQPSDAHVTSMVPNYEGDHTLLLQQPLGATVRARFTLEVRSLKIGRAHV